MTMELPKVLMISLIPLARYSLSESVGVQTLALDKRFVCLTTGGDDENTVQVLRIKRLVVLGVRRGDRVEIGILHLFLVSEDIQTFTSEGDLRLPVLGAFARCLGLCDLPHNIVHNIVGRRGLVVCQVFDELRWVGKPEKQEVLEIL